MIFDQVWFYI